MHHGHQTQGQVGHKRPIQRGFTLIELMLVVVIAAVLMAVALPSYQQYMMKSRRSDALTALSAVVQAQERWRSNNASYASALDDLGIATRTKGQHYTLSLVGVGNPVGFVAGFEVHAVPVSGGRQSGDSDCSDIFIRVRGGNLSYLDGNPATTNASAVCWPQ